MGDFDRFLERNWMTWSLLIAVGLGMLMSNADAQVEDEEVLIFDAQPAQTGSATGGTVIFPLESKQWRFWYENVWGARVTPDGRRIAYRFGEYFNIADSDGQNPRILSHKPGGGLVQAWSPLGDQYMYGGDIYDLDGNLVKDLEYRDDLEHDRETLTPWAWSPDGGKVAFTRYRVWIGDSNIERHQTIHSIDIETGAIRMLYESIPRIIEGEGVDDLLYMATWSPDGTKIAGVYHKRVVTRVPNGNGGLYYLYEFEENIVTIPANGGQPTLVTSFPKFYSDGTLNPENFATYAGTINQIVWSPDSSNIAYSISPNAPKGGTVPQGIYRVPASGGSSEFLTGFVPGGYTDPGSLQWTILNPSGIKAEILLPSGPHKVSEPILAKVKVTSFEDDPVTVSFPDGLLVADDETILEVGTNEVEPFVLDQTTKIREFEVLVSPKKFGVGNVTTTVSGEMAGEMFTATDTKEIVVPSLSVTLKMLPLANGKPMVNFKKAEDGSITDLEGNLVVPKVEVTVTNIGEEAVTGLLQGVDPRARDRAAVAARIKTSGAFPIDLGELASGASKTKEIAVDIKEDGRFEFQAVVTATYASGGRQFNSVGRGAPIAVNERYEVELELNYVPTPAIISRNNGAYLVKPGSSLKLLGAVKNLTSNSTLNFYGLGAKKRLNAFGARLTSTLASGLTPPIVHDHEVAANGAASLVALIQTEVSGAGAGTVEWLELEDMEMIDDATGEKRQLEMDDVLITGDACGWLGNDLALRIIQNRSSEDVPEISVGGSVAYFSYGAMVGIGKWMGDSIDAIGGIGRVAGAVYENPSLFSDAMGEGARAVWETAEMLANTWDGMSPEEKEEFVSSLVDEVRYRALLLSTTRSPFDQDDREAAAAFVNGAVYSLFDGVEAAYETGDPRLIAEAFGKVSGNIAMEVAAATIPAPKFAQFTKAADAAKLATNSNAARLITEQGNFLRTVVSGAVDAAGVRKWGVGGKQLVELKNLFKAMKVKGYLRERSPRAFRLIDELGEAVWKPELMKPKGISEMDHLILDDPSVLPKIIGENGEELGLDGITAIFLPEADEIIEHRVRSRLIARGDYPLDRIEEGVKACLNRAQKRREEFAEFVPEFEAWKADTIVNDGGIPISRNYKDNGVPDPVGAKDDVRRFNFDRYAREGKEIIYIPKMADKDNVLRFISGDIDWIHFSSLDGSPLDAKKARALYDAMFRCCGLQHPETISWILDGQTVFKGKLNQLSDYILGGKALLEITGESTRAVRINTELTRFAKNARDHLIFFDGGTKSRIKSKLADVESALASITARFPDHRLVLPFLQGSAFDDALQEAGGESGGWNYSTEDDGALILRENKNGEFQSYDGENWADWPSPGGAPPRAKDASLISLAPTSSLVSEFAAGSSQIAIVDLPSLWVDQLTGRVLDWFSVGDKIVIGPGTLTQEVRTIVSLEPLTLSSPLTFTQPEGALVAVVPQDMSVVSVVDPPGRLVSTVVDSEESDVALIWEVVLGRRYQLEVEQAPGIWGQVVAPISARDRVVTTLVALTDYDPGQSYRLVDIGPALVDPPFLITSIGVDRDLGLTTIHWTSEPGRNYAVEIASELDGENWVQLEPALSASDLMTHAVIESDVGQERLFFRIRDLDAVVDIAPTEVLSVELDHSLNTVKLVWRSEPGVEYQIESATDLDQVDWNPIEPRVAATSVTTSYVITRTVLAEREFYRVRRAGS